MPLPLIKAEIDRFLASTAPEIICIRGRWGVGKTFAWRRLLKEAEEGRRIGCKSYAYVSLFGQNSLTDLRNSIIENTVSATDVQAKPTLANLQDPASLKRRAFQWIGQGAALAPQSNSYAFLAQRILYLLVRDTVICLDDLERAGSGLNLKDVLGLASQLKDEKGCKVVLLLNAEKLRTEGKDDFAEQLEKVVDVAIDFQLSSEEAAGIALNPGTAFHEHLRANCVKLKIDNIRVIRKAERFCAHLQPVLAEFDPRVLSQAVHTATIACFAKYQPDLAPSLDDLRTFDVWRSMRPSENGDGRENYRQLLADYDFLNVDNFDRSVIDAVDRGFFDEAQMKARAAEIAGKLRSGDMTSDYFRAWEIFRSSFGDNADGLVAAFRAAVERSVAIIDPPKLDGIVTTLRQLGRETVASELIAFFVAHKAGESASFWNLDSFSYIGGIKDGELQAAMRERHAAAEGPPDPVETLKRLGSQAGWGQRDEATVAGLSEDDIICMFRTLTGEDFALVIAATKRLLSISNPSEATKEYCHKAKAALRQIADDGTLNAMRVDALFGVWAPKREE